MIHNIDNLPAEIVLGQQREKGANSVLFNVTAWQALYPTGAASVAPDAVSDGLRITYTRQGEATVYPEDAARLSLTDSILTWTPSDAVLDIAGPGTVVVHCKEGGIEKCSAMACTYVVPGHAAAGDPPEPLKDYIAKWGSVDIELTEVEPGTPAEVAVTQDGDGTHFHLTLPTDMTKWADVDITISAVAHDAPAAGSITQDETGTHISLDIPAAPPVLYVGETEPTDPETMVWVDPDEPGEFNPEIFEQRLAALEALHPE